MWNVEFTLKADAAFLASGMLTQHEIIQKLKTIENNGVRTEWHIASVNSNYEVYILDLPRTVKEIVVCIWENTPQGPWSLYVTDIAVIPTIGRQERFDLAKEASKAFGILPSNLRIVI